MTETILVARRTSKGDLLTLALSGQPITAWAVDKPCEMYRDHGSSTPSMTQGHHVFPVYLQNRIYGKITLPDLVFLCGTCHDSTHAWLYFLLGERREPFPHPAPRAKAQAKVAHDWYIAALAEKQPA